MAIVSRNKESALAMVEDKAKEKKGSLKMTGKMLPKPVAQAKEKPKPKPTIKARPRVKTVTAVANTEEKEILAMLDTDPSKAIQMMNARNRRIEAERKERKRYLALSDREKLREKEVKEKTKAAIKSLTANLDKLDVNPNWNHNVIWNRIADMCFRSSLEADVLWISTATGSLEFKIKADQIPLSSNELDPVAEKLISWSKIKFNSSEYTGAKLSDALANSASTYQREEAKLKSSEFYLNELVARSLEAKLEYDKETAKRYEILEALSLATAEIGISLGFYRDKNKNVWINCSDSKFQSSEISKKVLLPYMQRIIDGSTVAGKLNSNEDAGKLLTGFINQITN